MFDLCRTQTIFFVLALVFALWGPEGKLTKTTTFSFSMTTGPFGLKLCGHSLLNDHIRVTKFQPDPSPGSWLGRKLGLHFVTSHKM